MSKILTAAGYIFSRPVSFETSIDMEKGCNFMFAIRSSFSTGATARFNMHMAFIDAE